MTKNNDATKKHTFLWDFVIPIVLGLLLAFLTGRFIFHVLEIRFSTLGNVFLYLFFYFMMNAIIGKIRRDPKSGKPQRHPAQDWPRSGPIGSLGVYGMSFTFYPTAMLSVLNPWQFIQQMKQLVGMAKISKRLDSKPDYYMQYQTKVDYVYPFKGEWLIINGGYTEQTSHSWGVLTQRYAFDFVKADKAYKRHFNKGTKLADYYCYEQPINAAADGEVISVKNGINPAPLVGWGVADFLCLHFAGNHVIIKHADGEYGFYAHLVRDSIPLKPGDIVKQGDLIGLCGHTGHSTEPHLHFHLQDGPNLFTAMGLPIEFNQQRIERGHFVSNPEPGVSLVREDAL